MSRRFFRKEKPFVTASEAFHLLESGRPILFVDCRHQLADPTAGQQMYTQSHLPGALFAHIDDDLSGEVTGKNGRHPLPPIESFKKWLVDNGVDKDLTVVAYDNVGGGFAARLWWMLGTLGYKHPHILEGGFEAWVNEGLPTETEPTLREPLTYIPELPPTWEDGLFPTANMEEVDQQDDQPMNDLVDSRNPERFRGEESGPDPVAGRIPGAFNRWWQANLDQNFRLRSREELRGEFDLLMTDKKAGNIIFYCGSGVTACFNIAVVQELGFGLAKLYPGSWSEWVANKPGKVEMDDELHSPPKVTHESAEE